MTAIQNAWLVAILASALVGGGGYVGYSMMTQPSASGCGNMGMMNTGMMGTGSGMMGGMDNTTMQQHAREMYARCQAMMSSAGNATSTTASGTRVEMRNSQFQPSLLKVPAGTTVTWTNRDGYAHTVTRDSGAAPLNSNTLAPNASWSYTFTQPGTYDYHCEPHSYRDSSGAYRGMTGRIIVTGTP